jgi:hypothetical protein
LSDEDVTEISRMTNLRYLNLSKTNIQDSQLARLCVVTTLEELELSETGVSDSGVKALIKLPKLRYLGLENSRVTSECMRELYTSIPGIRTRLFGAGAGVAGSILQPALGKIVLVQYGPQRLAFKFTEITNRGDGGAKYVWLRLDSGKESVHQGEGEVFDNYRLQVAGGKEWVENDGGVQSLQMGTARLFWSRPLTVYLPYRWEKNAVKMALTPWDRFEEIDFDTKLLAWHQTADK